MFSCKIYKEHSKEDQWTAASVLALSINSDNLSKDYG